MPFLPNLCIQRAILKRWFLEKNAKLGFIELFFVSKELKMEHTLIMAFSKAGKIFLFGLTVLLLEEPGESKN